MSKITIFTDGSSRGNPGSGGWGSVVVNGENVYELGGRENKTTNNRMEMMAIIKGLESVKEKNNISIYTDSAYVINGITKWVKGWEKNDWVTATKTPVLNSDLWKELVKVSEKKDIDWKLIPGHSGVKANERCDEIATGFADNDLVNLYKGLLRDYSYDPLDLQVGEVKKKSKNSGKAYSYVSSIDGDVVVHKAWEDCEKRVKGKKAQFKKVFSSKEEQELVTLWGKGGKI